MQLAIFQYLSALLYLFTLFILYTADLADVAKAYGVNPHSYADDTQLHLQCHQWKMTTAVQWLEMCITDVSHWMAANGLK